MDAIRGVYEELNFPSADKLKRALKARGIPFAAKDVANLVREDVVRAVQAPGYKFTGKIASSHLDSRWFADLIDFSAAPSDGGRRVKALEEATKPKGKKYILVVQDVFSRMIWAEALEDKRGQTVLAAFKRIMEKSGRKPMSLTTDGGSEFGQYFEGPVQSLGIEVKHKQPIDVNAIATLDVAIGQLKKALARVARSADVDDWSTVLQRVVAGQNKVPNNEYLEGQAPSSVAGNAALREHLEDKNRDFSATNHAQAEQRKRALSAAGGFRVPAVAHGQVRGGRRAWKPTFEADVLRVKQFTPGARIVVDQATDKAYDTRFVKPARPPAEGAAAASSSRPTLIERGGSEQVRAGQRRALQTYANQVAAKLGQDEMLVQQTRHFLDSQPAFREAAARVRVNKNGLYKHFLALFPDLFEFRPAPDGQNTLVKLRRR